LTAKKIQAVALKHFSQKGYDGTSLADIAGEVGIKKPSIYAHFESKFDLFAAVVEEVSEDYRAYRQTVISGSSSMDFEQHLFNIFSSMITYFIQDRVKMAFWVRLWMFPPAESPEALLEPWKNLNKTFLDEVIAIFEQGISEGHVRQGSPQDMAHTYLCLLDGFLTRVIISDDADYSQHMTQVWQCFWAGAKA